MNSNIKTFEIIRNSNEWNELLHEIENYDFYHTYDYHLIEMLDDQVPALIKYKEMDCVIALPLLIRRISNTIAGSVVQG